MQRFAGVARSEKGAAIDGATVTVKLSGVNATIYSDNGVTARANPFLTAADGEVAFYAANGRYTVSVSHPNFNNGVAKEFPAILFDPAEAGVLTGDIRRVSGSTNVIYADRVLKCNTSGGAISVTLLPANDAKARDILIINDGTNPVTVLPQGADTVDGATSVVLRAQGEFLHLAPDAVTGNWYPIG